MTRSTHRRRSAWLPRLLRRPRVARDPSPVASIEPQRERLVNVKPAAPRRGEPSVAELAAEAAYSRDRLTLYRRRMTLGRGDPSRLRALERAADGANTRLSRARETRAEHA